MYVWTAYYEYYNDSGLVITKAIESYDVLLKWHTMDKPDALEGHRNDFSQTSNQKNRNPFVDHPEYAWQIFGDNVSASVKEACKAAYPVDDPQSGGSSSSSEPVTSSEPVYSSEESSGAESSCVDYPSSSEENTSQEETATSQITTSSEIVSSSESNNGNNKKGVGCRGSIIGTISLAGVGALVGLVFIFSKKKEQ